MKNYKRVEVGKTYRKMEVLEIYKGKNGHGKEAVMIRYYDHKWNEERKNAYNTFIPAYVSKSQHTDL